MITIRFDGSEYRVPARDGRELGAYYTDDRQDALGTAALMYPGHESHEFKVVRVQELTTSDRNGRPHSCPQCVISPQLVMLNEREIDKTVSSPEHVREFLGQTESKLKEAVELVPPGASFAIED